MVRNQELPTLRLGLTKKPAMWPASLLSLLLLGGFLLPAFLLRGFLRGFLFHGHGTISSTGVEHPCDPPVDRRANDCEPRLTADSLCARTARMNALCCVSVVVLRYPTIDLVLLLRVEANTISKKNRNAYANR